jgi:hypothetical protein
MPAFKLSAAVLVAAGIAGASAAGTGSASAATGTTTHIHTAVTKLAVSPDPIAIGNSTVTVSGQLVTDTNGVLGVGIAGERVNVGEFIADGGNLRQLATATTGPDGSFSASVALPVGGDVAVLFTGDKHAGYSEAGASRIAAATPAPTSLTLGQ